MMQPNISKISITNNIEKIKSFLSEVILAPRAQMIKWSSITNQTPNLKIGYPGQHLASLITGISGTGTGARGDDIADGSEVKSCSRVDQVDKCENCKSNVMRMQSVCPNCGSVEIRRNNDSKWLIAIRNQKELDLYLEKIPRMFFLISDYPNFSESDYDTLRFSSYEIWNQSERANNFRKLLIDYYQNIYLAHIKKDPKKTPAPKNFWPYSYQFYLCNPIKTFECIIKNANSSPKIQITKYVTPQTDRAELPSEDMPIELLKKEEITYLIKKGVKLDGLKALPEEYRNLLPLRDTSEAKPQKQTYHRFL